VHNNKGNRGVVLTNQGQPFPWCAECTQTLASFLLFSFASPPTLASGGNTEMFPKIDTQLLMMLSSSPQTVTPRYNEESRKRSVHELLGGDMFSAELSESLSPKRCKTIGNTFWPTSMLELDPCHVQQQQQQQNLLSTLNLLQLLLASNNVSSVAQPAPLPVPLPARALFEVGRKQSEDSLDSLCSGSSGEQAPADSEDTSSPVRKSRFRGVIWDKNSRAWRAKLSVKGKLMHVGLFEDEREAAIAWDKKAIEIRGHRTRLNFPSLIPDMYSVELTTRRVRKHL
jgi:hypothetical protein